MTAIWQRSDDGWRILSPSAFPDEASLHEQVEESPQLLPLSGSPHLTILGREVRLGSGYADLVGVERSGRPVIIEIKLARNAEARRAVVAQVLAYAANLFGLTADDFERRVLDRHLRQLGHASVADAVAADDQVGGFEVEAFEQALATNLRQGRFRLVFVLDEAPDELVDLVGYLEAVTPELVIDLVTVAQYEVGNSTIMVPQRVDPERQTVEAPAETTARDTGYSVPGAQEWMDRIDHAPEHARDQLRMLAEWALGLDAAGLVTLTCYHGKGEILTLLPRLPVEGVGLVTLWFDNRGGYIQFWRSVFERLAPAILPDVERATSPIPVGQGTSFREVSPAFLDLLTEAYREASNRVVSAGA